MNSIVVRRCTLAAAMTLCMVVRTSGQPVAQPASPAERLANWQEDLQFLSDAMGKRGISVDLKVGIATRGQMDFDKLYPRFREEIAAITADVPNLSDAEVVLRLMRLIASAHVGHNQVLATAMGFPPRLPVTFYWFSDGLAVTAATPAFASALAARVVRIGSMTPDQLLTAVEPYLSHENDVFLRGQAQDFVTKRAVLQHLGVIGSDGNVSVTLQKPGQAPFTLSMAFVRRSAAQVSLDEALHVPTLFSRSQPGKSYWHRYLPDSQTLFIQYNRCYDEPNDPFADFTRRVLADADAHSVTHVIVDLRYNSGGSDLVMGPLERGLAARLKSIGPVEALIGPMTFSSGMVAAIDLRKSLHATLVGGATGGKPSSYGEVQAVTLPHSMLVVQFTRKHDGSSNANEPVALEPDLAVPETLADALIGRDAAFEAAIAAKR